MINRGGVFFIASVEALQSALENKDITLHKTDGKYTLVPCIRYPCQSGAKKSCLIN